MVFGATPGRTLTAFVCVCVSQAPHRPAMEKMKRIKKRLSLTLRSSQTIDESLSELAEQMTIEDGGTKDNGWYLSLVPTVLDLYIFFN